MKKTLLVLLTIIMIAGLTACSFSKEKEKSVFEKMLESPVALMESSDGRKIYVWSRLDLASFASMRIEKHPLEPTDKEDDWLYRITYNPKEKVINGEEIVVSFHSDYLQIGPDYYLPEEGVDYGNILGWTEMKFEYFMKTYEAE
ncbi:MAG: hypothetical protein IKT01_02645 [Eubacteriaceae bacterium]|nr:hypothetical protein [Eubacteriaceae bacterium]